MREREISQRGRNILKRETRKRERPQRSREILPHTERKIPKRESSQRDSTEREREGDSKERELFKRGGVQKEGAPIHWRRIYLKGEIQRERGRERDQGERKI